MTIRRLDLRSYRQRSQAVAARHNSGDSRLHNLVLWMSPRWWTPATASARPRARRRNGRIAIGRPSSPSRSSPPGTSNTSRSDRVRAGVPTAAPPTHHRAPPSVHIRARADRGSRVLGAPWRPTQPAPPCGGGQPLGAIPGRRRVGHLPLRPGCHSVLPRPKRKDPISAPPPTRWLLPSG
jgi:hypothetical protein